MANERKRDQTTEANEAMNEKFSGDREHARRGDPRQQDNDAEPGSRRRIEGEAAEEANESARVRRPYP